MFRKVHLQLTLLFSVISSLILVIMSISYLFVAEKGLKNNSFFSFQRDMNTILANLEQMDVISYEWLLKIEDNGKYSMALYDGFRPLSFGSVTKTGGELALLQEASDYYDSLYPASLAENTGSLNTVHREFAFKDSGKQENYASVSYLKKKNGILKVLVLYPMGFLEGEIAKQRERFLVIIVTAILAVICFSWYFYKKTFKAHRGKPEEAASICGVRFSRAADATGSDALLPFRHEESQWVGEGGFCANHRGGRAADEQADRGYAVTGKCGYALL